MFYRGTQENKTINYFAHIRKGKKIHNNVIIAI